MTAARKACWTPGGSGQECDAEPCTSAPTDCDVGSAGLRYRSQNSQPAYRAMDQAAKIAKRLGPVEGLSRARNKFEGERAALALDCAA